MIGQVDKHMQTLVKKLRDIIAKTEDPVQIEHTMKQIQKIEKLHNDAKRAIKANHA
jgi:superoxide dismutase